VLVLIYRQLGKHFNPQFMLTSTFLGLASIVMEFISHRWAGILHCIEQHLDGFSMNRS